MIFDERILGVKLT